MSAAITLDVAGVQVRLSSPDKIYFAERGESKLDLVRYSKLQGGR